MIQTDRRLAAWSRIHSARRTCDKICLNDRGCVRSSSAIFQIPKCFSHLQVFSVMPRIRAVFSIGAMHGGGSERQLALLLRHQDRKKFEPFLYLVYRSGPLLDLIPDDVPVSSFEERTSPPRW